MLRDLISRPARVFIIVWSSQCVSMVGSGLTSFALGLWVVQRYGTATPFALIALFTALPTVAMAPMAGVVVDRRDRRLVMLLSDAGAGLATLAAALLLLLGDLRLWQIYLIAAANGLFAAFQQPVYLAATALLVPRKQLGRAAGMVQMAYAATDIVAPLLAGVLILTIDLHGVLLIDLMTFVIAAVCLLVVRFPSPQGRQRGPSRTQSSAVAAALREIAAGWKLIASRPGLAELLGLSGATNFATGMIAALLVPMLATMTSADVIGAIISVAGGGMLMGSLVMSLWGGPRRRMTGVIGFTLLKGLGILIMGLRPSVWLIALGATAAHVSIPIANASDQAIWQERVRADHQGRVFATRHMIARAAMPLAYLLAGPLSDRLLEPLMTGHGPAVGIVQPLLGSGPGRGMGLIFVLMGGLIMLVSAAGALSPRLRSLDD
jgi:MFS family permease